MKSTTIGFPFFASMTAAALLAACDGPSPTGTTEAQTQTSALTAADRLAACASDPRVVTGLSTQQICAGADIFFNETFNGNGRTCGTCHPASNNTTIDPAFVSNLHATKPTDPLFVFERNANLTNLETSDLREFSGILLTRFRSADLVARYGGEEFVVILEGSTVTNAALVAEDIRLDLEARVVRGPDEQAIRVTVSAGCAQIDPSNPTREALIEQADIALFAAKRAGRNRVVLA